MYVRSKIYSKKLIRSIIERFIICVIAGICLSVGWSESARDKFRKIIVQMILFIYVRGRLRVCVCVFCLINEFFNTKPVHIFWLSA